MHESSVCAVLTLKALEHASVTALKFSRLASDAGSGSGERSKNASSSSSETASSLLVDSGVDERSGSNVTFGRRSAAGDRHSFTLLYNPCQICARMGIVSIFGADSTAAYVFNFSSKKEIRIHVGALLIQYIDQGRPECCMYFLPTSGSGRATIAYQSGVATVGPEVIPFLCRVGKLDDPVLRRRSHCSHPEPKLRSESHATSQSPS
jgi:hypothetical protein